MCATRTQRISSSRYRQLQIVNRGRHLTYADLTHVDLTNANLDGGLIAGFFRLIACILQPMHFMIANHCTF